MTKTLYILPVLVLLGMLYVAYAQEDTIPPRFVSATADLDTSILTIEFDETIRTSGSDLHEMVIGPGRTDALRLTSATIIDPSADSSMLKLQLYQEHTRKIIEKYPTVVLRLEDEAVRDLSGNTNRDTTLPMTVTPEPDITPPRFVSATADLDTSILTIEFDETVDASRTSLDRMYFGSLGFPSYRNLGSAIIIDPYVDSSMLRLHLNPDQLSIDFDRGLGFQSNAVYDLSGNPHPSSHGWPVTVKTPKPSCTPPTSGDWNITQSCRLEADTQAPAGISIHAPATLVIPAGVTLDVDFERHGLLVREGAGLLIVSGGGMR